MTLEGSPRAGCSCGVRRQPGTGTLQLARPTRHRKLNRHVIHNQGYRGSGGGRAPRGRAWAVIAGAGVRTMLAKRAFLGLLLISWFPFFVRAVQIYAAANLPQAAFLAPTPEMFRREYLEQQETFVFFITGLFRLEGARRQGGGAVAAGLAASRLPTRCRAKSTMC